MSQSRTCIQCGTALVGRSDKRYCSDPCRHLANNVIKQQNQHERRILQINTALRRNRSILKQLSPQGKTTLPRQYLELAGFDFRYLTQIYRTQKATPTTCAMTTAICCCPRRRSSSSTGNLIWTNRLFLSYSHISCHSS